MNIKEFSELLSTTPYTVRYYEQTGLLRPSRNINGYRNYNAKDINSMRLILALKVMNVPLKDIKLIMQLKMCETSLHCKQSTLDFIQHYLTHFKTHFNMIQTFIQVLETLQQEIQYMDNIHDDKIVSILNQLNLKESDEHTD